MQYVTYNIFTELKPSPRPDTNKSLPQVVVKDLNRTRDVPERTRSDKWTTLSRDRRGQNRRPNSQQCSSVSNRDGGRRAKSPEKKSSRLESERKTEGVKSDTDIPRIINKERFIAPKKQETKKTYRMLRRQENHLEILLIEEFRRKSLPIKITGNTVSTKSKNRKISPNKVKSLDKANADSTDGLRNPKEAEVDPSATRDQNQQEDSDVPPKVTPEENKQENDDVHSSAPQDKNKQEDDNIPPEDKPEENKQQDDDVHPNAPREQNKQEDGNEPPKAKPQDKQQEKLYEQLNPKKSCVETALKTSPLPQRSPRPGVGRKNKKSEQKIKEIIPEKKEQTAELKDNDTDSKEIEAECKVKETEDPKVPEENIENPIHNEPSKNGVQDQVVDCITPPDVPPETTVSETNISSEMYLGENCQQEDNESSQTAPTPAEYIEGTAYVQQLSGFVGKYKINVTLKNTGKVTRCSKLECGMLSSKSN